MQAIPFCFESYILGFLESIAFVKSHFLHSLQLPALKLHDNLMQGGALSESLYPRCLGMSDSPIHILSLLIEHGVGKVVILIDDEIKRIAFRPRLALDDGELNSCIFYNRENDLYKFSKRNVQKSPFFRCLFSCLRISFKRLLIGV